MIKQQGLRVVGLATLGCVSALVLRRHGLPFWSTAFSVGILGQCSWAMLRRCATAWPDAKRAWLRMGVCGMRWFRRFYRATPGVAFVAPASLFLLLSMALVALLLFSTTIYHAGAWIWMVLLGLMGAAECVQRTRRLMALAWARAAGRVMLLGLGALVGVVAHVLANHLAYQANPVDPKFYPSFVALVSVVLTPLLYVYAFAVLVAAWAVLELLVLLVLYFISQSLRILALCLGQTRWHDVVVYRLVYGRRPTAGHQRELFEDGQVLVLRTLSMVVCVIGVLAGMGRLTEGQEARVNRWSRRALVAVEYQPGGQCGTSSTDNYLPLEYDRISVAHNRSQDLVFEVTHCPEMARSDALAGIQAPTGRKAGDYHQLFRKQ
jgi:hypothetical protein